MVAYGVDAFPDPPEKLYPFGMSAEQWAEYLDREYDREMDRRLLEEAE
jgi:hypothetical protein